MKGEEAVQAVDSDLAKEEVQPCLVRVPRSPLDAVEAVADVAPAVEEVAGVIVAVQEVAAADVVEVDEEVGEVASEPAPEVAVEVAAAGVADVVEGCVGYGLYVMLQLLLQ